jgi:glycosyltransferase involved in cell wall biosynthesis
MVSVAYHGPFLDYSGYGEANRQFINALVEAGVDVEAQLVRFTPKKDIDLGHTADVAAIHANVRHDYKIKIIHTTPDSLYRFVEPNVYKISHLFWETDCLPRSFVEGLDLVDEIWTGSQANADAIRNSGVDKPIYIFPQPFYVEKNNFDNVDFLLNGESFEGFKFYSIFEWTDRKNPEVLIKSFLSEFDGVKDVCLVLKTYFQDNSTASHNQAILNQIAQYQEDLNLKDPPVIFVVMVITDRAKVMALHNSCDCYVSPHRGEGWGIPVVEAMSIGNPVIVTSYGGIGEYLTYGKNGFPLPFQMVALSGMDHARHYYEIGQNWAYVSSKDVRLAMRTVYENRQKAEKIGRSGQKFVLSKLSPLEVGKLMKSRLEEIEKEINENSLYQ